MSMETLTSDVDAAAVAGNSDAYSLASATQARQKNTVLLLFFFFFLYIMQKQTIANSGVPV